MTKNKLFELLCEEVNNILNAYGDVTNVCRKHNLQFEDIETMLYQLQKQGLILLCCDWDFSEKRQYQLI